MTDDSVFVADLYSHRSLNEFIAYDEAMCQCPDVCRCPGYDNDEGDPMKLPLGSEPLRALLIPVALAAFVAAGQAFIAGADTRAIITAVVGALIVAAQEVGRSLVTPIPKATGEDGLTSLELIGLLCLAGIVALLIIIAT